MKYRLTIYLFILVRFNIYCQTSTDDLVNNFFKLYEINQDIALDTLFKTNKLFPNEKIESVKLKLKNLVAQIGDYNGFEFIQKQSAGNSLSQYYFILKYERQPIKFIFVFYKPKDQWILYNYKFDSDVDVDLERAAKITLFIDK